MSAPTQFRKKPVVISAIQWTGENLVDVIHFTDGRPPNNKSSHAGMMWDQYVDVVRKDGLKIFTMEGKMDASIGDWIIKGVKGEHYPCKPEIFALTYDDASASTDLSQAAVAAALEAAAAKLQNVADNWDCGHNESRLCDCAPYVEQWGFAADEIRALITPAQHDALAAELAAQTQRAREAEAEAHACGAEREAWKDRAEAAEAQVADLTAKLGAITEAFGYSAIDLAFLREEHAEWSQRQFGDVSAVGPAKHLSKEALEVASDPTDAIEHADCWMLLWDMQRRAGISDEQLARAIYEKLAVNKARKWPEPKEGEAREHDRAALKAGGAA